jgi:hypothetical protein
MLELLSLSLSLFKPLSFSCYLLSIEYLSFSLIGLFFQNTIENQWLGFNKVLLFGKPVEKERTASLDKKMAGLTKYFDLICFPTDNVCMPIH